MNQYFKSLSKLVLTMWQTMCQVGNLLHDAAMNDILSVLSLWLLALLTHVFMGHNQYYIPLTRTFLKEQSTEKGLSFCEALSIKTPVS